MKTVCIHIIRETGGASDTGDHHEIFLTVADLREYVGNGCKNGMSSATGAPFYHLVAYEIGFV
jgi:hypothetical protein